jgi:capsular exopolysaccharide synthesis family protein
MGNSMSYQSEGQASAIDPAMAAGSAVALRAPIEKTGIRLPDILALIRREQWLIGGFSLAGPLAAIALTALTPPIYQAVLMLKIDNERAKIVEGQALVDPIVALGDTSRYLTTLSKLTTSRSLAASVMESLSLAKDDSFLKAMGKSLPASDLSAAQRENERRESVIKVLTENVGMIAPGDSRIVQITFNSRNPALAAEITNAYGERFLAQNVQQQANANAYATKILRQQVEETRVQLSDAESKAITYAQENDLIDASDAASGADNGTGNGKEAGGARSITTASLVEMNSNYNSARAARIAVEQRWRTAEAAAGTSFPEARENGTLQALLQQRAGSVATLEKLRTHYIATQPDVVEAATNVRVLDDQIADAIRSIKMSIKAEYNTAMNAERAMLEQKESLASETIEEQRKRVQLNLLARDADTLRQQLRDLLTRLNQVTSAADVENNNMLIVDKAEQPELPVSPNLLKNLLLGIVAGIGLGVLAAVLRQIVDDTLHTPEDVESKLGLPLLGVTPWVGDAINDELTRPLSGLREAYHSIRTAVDFASGGNQQKVIQVTSSASDEGKSTASLAIAQDFARIGRKVLLIDCDMRRPSLYKHFGISKEDKGLSDVILGLSEYSDVTYTDEDLGLVFMPMGTIPTNPSPLLSSDALTEFFAARRSEFDVIVVDSPPVIGLADSPLLSRHSDKVIFVVEASRAHYGQVKSAIRRMRNHGASVLGAIVSKYDAQTSGYGYQYGYGYGYGYGYNYS